MAKGLELKVTRQLRKEKIKCGICKKRYCMDRSVHMDYCINHIAGIGTKYGNLKVQCNKRFGIYPKITREQYSYLVGTDCCFYCLGPLSLRGYNLDRVDNTRLGYDADNLVPCCKICNGMKSNLKMEEFVRHIKKITKYGIKFLNNIK